MQKPRVQCTQQGCTVVILRVSSKERTTRNQRLALQSHVKALPKAQQKRLEWREYNGVSMRNGWRQVCEELFKEIETGRIAEIHLWRVCRAGRDLELTVRLWNRCVERGVLLWYVDDHVRSDNPDDVDYMGFLAIAAQRERRMISKCTKEGLRRAMLDGWRPTSRLGHRDKRVLKKVKAILLLADDGASYREIFAATGVHRKTVKSVCLEHGRKAYIKERNDASTRQTNHRNRHG